MVTLESEQCPQASHSGSKALVDRANGGRGEPGTHGSRLANVVTEAQKCDEYVLNDVVNLFVATEEAIGETRDVLRVAANERVNVVGRDRFGARRVTR